jgi:uncharacterized membrane protein YjgN (DUF898 family)
MSRYKNGSGGLMENFQGGASVAAPASSRYEMRFAGSGSEYFKIWIVNLALTIVTLGIFSAWAKVRSRRYFLGNTFVAGHSFDYHGDPKRILLGRIIALALLLGYTLSANFGGPKVVAVWIVVFVVALPWLVKSSFRFNARNTSYRNVRFDFHGGYGGAFWAFVAWPVFTVLSLLTLLPLAHRARDYYNINNHSFSSKSFEAEISGGALYAIYLQALGMIAGAIIVAVLIFSVSGAMAVLASGSLKPGQTPQFGVAPMVFMAGAIFLYFAIFLFASAFIQAKTFNLAVSSSRLDGKLQLEANLSPFAMLWLIVSNLIVVLLTLGLMYPWARIRQTRYITERLAITGPANLNGYTSTAASQSGAIGEEVAGFFDIDFGL